ncbi:hypothetical protein PG994_011877 [Apiospora phragmitis]|uniref:Uncharacterized protein n=1 Tax=Apiospora phragmitis TaxID=2905665 RepID=A0ABR1TU66_9PEZI
MPPAGPPAAGGAGGGFFQDNPFASGGGQNQMPGTAPPMDGGIPPMDGGTRPMTGVGGGGLPPMPGAGGGGGFYNDYPFENPGHRCSLEATKGDIQFRAAPGPSPASVVVLNTFPSEVEILKDKPGCPATRASESVRIEDLSFELAPICPDHDGKLYQSRGGATFMVQCCSHGGGERIRTVMAEDFRRCMGNCPATDDCHSVQYTARDYGEPVGTCIMNKKGGLAKAACGVPDQHTYAFVVDPPAIEPANQHLTVKCSTECPSGHGQPFKTESGEIFQLTCGKRHGTKMIHRDNQPTMMDCMNSCGRLMQCDSVDYDMHRNIS